MVAGVQHRVQWVEGDGEDASRSTNAADALGIKEIIVQCSRIADNEHITITLITSNELKKQLAPRKEYQNNQVDIQLDTSALIGPSLVKNHNTGENFACPCRFCCYFRRSWYSRGNSSRRNALKSASLSGVIRAKP